MRGGRAWKGQKVRELQVALLTVPQILVVNSFQLETLAKARDISVRPIWLIYRTFTFKAHVPAKSVSNSVLHPISLRIFEAKLSTQISHNRKPSNNNLLPYAARMLRSPSAVSLFLTLIFTNCSPNFCIFNPSPSSGVNIALGLNSRACPASSVTILFRIRCRFLFVLSSPVLAPLTPTRCDDRVLSHSGEGEAVNDGHGREIEESRRDGRFLGSDDDARGEMALLWS